MLCSLVSVRLLYLFACLLVRLFAWSLVRSIARSTPRSLTLSLSLSSMPPLKPPPPPPAPPRMYLFSDTVPNFVDRIFADIYCACLFGSATKRTDLFVHTWLSGTRALTYRSQGFYRRPFAVYSVGRFYIVAISARRALSFFLLFFSAAFLFSPVLRGRRTRGYCSGSIKSALPR